MTGFMDFLTEISNFRFDHHNRAVGFRKTEVSRFFDQLEDLMKRYKFTGAQIFNMDESGFNTVQKPPKVLAEKGKRAVAVLTSAERGINVTVVCCTSATGQFVPPHFFFLGRISLIF